MVTTTTTSNFPTTTGKHSSFDETSLTDISATSTLDDLSSYSSSSSFTNKNKRTTTSHVIDPRRVYKVSLTPIEFALGCIVTEPPNVPSVRLQTIVQQERQACNADVTVVFAIRRPGCGACREHGQQLTHLTELFPPGVVHCIGIIKQINVDNAALISFRDDYFNRNPIYKDAKWAIYDAMGNRKISPFKFLAALPKMTLRYHRKKIENIPLGGDLFTQGGVLIFDRNGNLVHTIYETYSEELDMDELYQAVEQARTLDDCGLPTMNPY